MSRPPRGAMAGVAAALLLAGGLVAAAPVTVSGATVTAPVTVRGATVTAPVAATGALVQVVGRLREARDALPGDPEAAGRDVDAAAALIPDPSGLDAIRSALDAGDIGRARQLLGDEVAALDVPDGAVAPDPSSARRTLDGVYARPPLDALDRGTAASGGDPPVIGALARLLRWVTDRLGRRGSVAVGAVALVAVVALLAWLARRTLTRRDLSILAELPQAGAGPDAEWSAALAAGAGGDHREAVRRAFRSALLSVAVRGHLAVDASWTNRELLARVRGDADLVAALAPAATGFEQAWYSRRPVTAADWELARARCAVIRELARRPARSPAPGPAAS